MRISASLRVGGKRIKSDKRRGNRGRTLSAGSRDKLYAKFLRNPARAIRRALDRGKRPVAKVQVKATQLNTTKSVTVVRRVRLRYP